MFIRVANTLLGIWLFVSAFLWPHTTPQFFNGWVVGLLVTGFGAAAIFGFVPGRFVNFALGLWLFFSAMFLPRASGASAVHDVIVAVALVLTSLFPAAVERHREPAPATR